ncbi:MAG: prohibitin family protein [Spirochaetota bacterium]
MAKEKVVHINGGFWNKLLGSGNKWMVFVLILIIVFAVQLLNPFTKISAGHRGVILNFGAVSDRVLSEGLHFRVPIVQSIVEIDVRVKKNETKTNASSKDLQTITTHIALNFHLDPAKVNILYRDVGESYEVNIIDPAVKEVVKAATAKYTADEVITKREVVSNTIKEALAKRLAKYNILIDDFSIKDFSFSKAFADAIEAKQEAEQLAQKAERDLKRVEMEAKQKIERAKADAETLRLKNQSVTPLMIQLNAIEKWDGKLPTYMAPGAPLPFIKLK